ncbi:hypothetical protein PNOK_0002600 [Pyrrhoderma noxium]|uniref:Uncharacterized protein n=1 Tax=Pyrrhoderma noxium TaxID=2282107 RepID=A0A286UTQ9_9AGAM|nr:hypothetical protein PNOK_0002600 [Pyrrhoderma noxium]
MPMRPFDVYVHPDFKYQPFESYHGSTILAHSMPVLIIGGAAFTILASSSNTLMNMPLLLFPFFAFTSIPIFFLLQSSFLTIFHKPTIPYSTLSPLAYRFGSVRVTTCRRLFSRIRRVKTKSYE